MFLRFLAENRFLPILSVYWAAPFKIHTPNVEDFGQVHQMGSGNFQMHPFYFLYYSSQGE